MDINTDAPVITRDEIHISADMQTVWNIQTNVTDWPSWQPDVDGAESDGPLNVGSVFRWQTAGLDITSTGRGRPSAPDRLGRAGARDRRLHVWTFDEQDDGVLVRTAESWEGDPVTAQPETLQPAPRWLVARLAGESQARRRTRGGRIAADASYAYGRSGP
jgi:hypothetical protein